MLFLEFIYGDVVLGVVLAFLLAGGTLLPTDEFKKFKIAKGCWWLLALYLCGRVLMWSVLTSERLHVRAFWVFLAFGIVGVACSEMVRAIGHREARLATAEQELPKPPPIQQSSQGANSPNTKITGNNNTVNNTVIMGDPQNKAKMEEIASDTSGRANKAPTSSPAKSNHPIPVKPVPKKSFQSTQVREALARLVADLSQEVADLAIEQQPEEQALPPLNPSLREDKSNQPWLMLQSYRSETKEKFHVRKLEIRCMRLMYTLSNRIDLSDEVLTIQRLCGYLPGNVLELRQLSVSLATLAQKVEEPPKD